MADGDIPLGYSTVAVLVVGHGKCHLQVAIYTGAARDLHAK